MSDDMDLKRRLDAMPREIEPPEDLWPGVRARLKSGTGAQVHRGTRAQLRMAALLTLMAVSAGALMVQRARAGRWQIATSDGGLGRFAAGELLRTGEGRARFLVGTIGTVDVSPRSDLRLLEARPGSHRLALSHGRIEARISAPPRLFVVRTPHATAVDLGCAYTLEVDSAGGATWLHVTEGWVSLEANGREALIPAGFRARAHTVDRGGLGTPVADDAPAELAYAVQLYERDASDSALAAIVRSARAVDAVTLWHLAQTARHGHDGAFHERLRRLVPPPADVIGADPYFMHDAGRMRMYWQYLPRTLPIAPAWRMAVWRAWTKIVG